MLKSLELSGFKSFAHKTVLDFNAPVSAIVGPNGSGKSNAAEAFRFVLGEQSMKSMRTKKSEDLLFNGSSKTPRANRAHAKLTFDNSDRILDIDYDKVVVERVVHRDSSNEYLINSSRVRLKDIIELMASANIGSSGHHIISQGESDRILLVRPEERKRMIEDALGLKIYHVKRKEALKKLRKTHENLKKIKSLRRELAPHFEFAQKQVSKIEKSKELKEELSEKAADYFAHVSRALKKKEELLEEENVPSRENIERLRREIEELEEKTKKERASAHRVEEIEGLEKKRDELREGVGKVEREIGKVEGVLEAKGAIRLTHSVHIERSVLEELIEKARLGLEGSANEAHGALHTIISILSSFAGEITSGDRKEYTELKEKREVLSEKREEVERRYNHIVERIKKEQENIRNKERKASEEEKRSIALKGERVHLLSERKAFLAEKERIESDRNRLKEDVGEVSSLVGRGVMNYENIEISSLKEESLLEKERREIEKLKLKLEDIKVGSEKEIRNVFEDIRDRVEFFNKEIKDLKKSRKALMELADELEEKLRVTFDEGVEKINGEFQRLFELMFGGGKAVLDVVREKKEDGEVREGLEIDVHMPHKRVRGLHMLSGGERALTSIALLFAVSQINPPPFIILDETDAALDEANSKKYGDMIENLSEKSQLVLVTHNRETMSRARILYGVTMGSDGVSRLLSVKFDDAVRAAKR